MSGLCNTMPYNIGMSILVIALAIPIPFGLVMAIHMDNPAWLWFCVPIFIFLS